MTHHRCPGREESVHRYLDGDLSPTEREAFVAHLQHCPACQSLLAELQGVFSDFRAMEEAATPPDLVSQVMARLPETTAPVACLGRSETVQRFVDGELSPAEQADFDLHLVQCPACRRLLADLQTLSARLASLEEVAPPPGLVEQVMAALPAGASSSERRLLGRFVVAGQIAIGLALLAMARPIVVSALETPQMWLPWQQASDMARSLAGWLVEIGLTSGQQLQSQWPPAVDLSGLDLSSGLALAIVAALGLAWLAGNTMLLRDKPPSLRNGGSL